MQDARWLFFDLGNTLISEERAWERRIQRLVSSLERYGRRWAIEEVRAAFREASEEFAPRLITRAIEKLIDDHCCPAPAILSSSVATTTLSPSGIASLMTMVYDRPGSLTTQRRRVRSPHDPAPPFRRI